MDRKRKSVAIVVMILVIFIMIGIFLGRKHTAISTVEMVDGLKEKYSTEEMTKVGTLSISVSQSEDLEVN
jgi:uncharacterized protein YneF (UPF0154 family)